MPPRSPASLVPVLLALLTVLQPAAGAIGSTVGTAATGGTGPGPERVHVHEEGPVSLDCARDVLLVLGDGFDPQVAPGDRFVVVSLQRATGPVLVNGVDVGSLAPEVPVHLLLRVTEDQERIAFSCLDGGSADVRSVDAPIVEAIELPMRVITATYTRPGLRALGMDNLFEVSLATPVAGNVTVDVEADGAPVPSTLQAMGEDANDSAQAWNRSLHRVLEDEDSVEHLTGTLRRIAFLCSGSPLEHPGGVLGWLNQAFSQREEACAAGNVARVLARYGVPAPHARELLDRLEEDPRCSRASLLGALDGLDPFTFQPLNAPPCLDLVTGWLDDTLQEEGLPTVGGTGGNAATALGLAPGYEDTNASSLLDRRPVGGPCGDEPVPSGPPDEGLPLSLVANRTSPERQAACADLLVGSLRPIRYAWDTGGLITQMNSLWYGASAISLAQETAGQARLTVSTQGPAFVDLTVGLEDPPGTLGDALAPVTEPGAAVLNETGLKPPEQPEVVDRALGTPVGPGAPAHLVGVAAEPVRENTSGPAREALETAPARCSLDLHPPPAAGPACTGGGQEPAGATRGPGDRRVTIWSTPPAEQLPAGTPRAYTAAQVPKSVHAFLAPPGTALRLASTAGVPTGVAGNTLNLTGDHASRVFVPHRLELTFGAPSELPATPGAGAQVRAFAGERLVELAELLPDRGLDPHTWQGQVPVELLLTGVTFHARWDQGVVNVSREGPSHRLLNLREGIETHDLDLDGIPDAEELLAPGLPGGQEGLVDTRPGLDPLDPDSDGDGMPDGYEWRQCGAQRGDRCEGLTPWLPDAEVDRDSDLLTNGEEANLSWAAINGSACTQRYRWRCLDQLAEQALEDPCPLEQPVLLAWSPGADNDPEAPSLDGDCDGFHDGWEVRFGYDSLASTDPMATSDPEDDALNHRQEFQAYVSAVAAYWTGREEEFPRSEARLLLAQPGEKGMMVDPTTNDTDGDGLPDGYEITRGFWTETDQGDHAPTDVPRRLGPLLHDSSEDPDGDGMTTLQEYRWSRRHLLQEHPELDREERVQRLTTWGLNPFLDDTDGDGAPDGVEVQALAGGDRCANPLEATLDCDGDGIDDRIERYIAGDPTLTDTARTWAVTHENCLRDPDTYLNASSMNWSTPDTDGDGIQDWYECWFGLDPTDTTDARTDADGDGLTSLAEYQHTIALDPLDGTTPATFNPGQNATTRQAAWNKTLLPIDIGFGEKVRDHDQDDLPDTYEVATGLDPFTKDPPLTTTPGNDPDQDGLTAWQEFTHTSHTGTSPRDHFARHVDLDITDRELLDRVRALRPSPADADTDGDGMSDGWEARFELDPADPGDAGLDPDGDGASNLREHGFTAGRYTDQVDEHGPGYLLRDGVAILDPRDNDTDGDALLDGQETRLHAEQGCAPTDTYETGSTTGTGWAHCFDPLNPDDADDDFDGDGLVNRFELEGWAVTRVTHKVHDPVYGDRVQTETIHTTANPLRASTSGDGLLDRQKAPRNLTGCNATASMDPQSRDTDGDGVTDYVEVWQWTAVQGLPMDIDGDCHINAVDKDSDGDSYLWANTTILDLSDGEELRLKLSDPTRTDTDGDLVPDGREIGQWRQLGQNPVNLTTDFDGDGLQPVWDWSSDGDRLPDGYEFWSGLDATVNSSDDQDSDGEGLTDLCEYRITVNGDQHGVCPDQAPPQGHGPAAPHGDQVAGADADENANLPDRVVCLNALESDCDQDGIDDRFEYVHREEYEGCNPNLWNNHLPDGERDRCLDAYTDHVSGLSKTLLKATNLTENVNASRVDSVLLGMDLTLEPSSAPCFYHRACRRAMEVGKDSLLELTIGVADANCNLDKVRVILRDRTLLMHDGTVRDEDWRDWPDPAFPEEAYTFEANALDHAQCKGEAPQDPEQPHSLTQRGRYTFTVSIPASLISQDLSRLGFHGRLDPWIVVSDTEGMLSDSPMSLELAGRGADIFTSANEGLRRKISQDTKELGKEILDGVATYVGHVREQARDRGGASDVGTAVRLIDQGLEGYLDGLHRLGTEYEHVRENAPSDCSYIDEDSTDDEIDRCLWEEWGEPIVREQVLPGRVRVIAGTRALEDLLRPAAEGFTAGTSLLFQAGVSEREVAQHLSGLLGGSLGATPSGGGLPGLDWFVPAFRANQDRGTGRCLNSQYLVENLRGSVADPPPAPGAGGYLDGLLHYEELASQFLPEAPPPGWDYECLRAAAGDPSISLNENLRSLVVLGLQGIEFVGNRMSPWQATALKFTWHVIEDTTRVDEAPVLNLVSCMGAAVAGFGATLLVGTAASGGFGTVVSLSYLGVNFLSCFEQLGGEQDRKVPPRVGSNTGVSHRLEYQVASYPDTDTDVDTRPGGLEELLTVHLATDIDDTIARCVEITQDADEVQVVETGIGYVVRVDRLAGASWVQESVVRLGYNDPMDLSNGFRSDAYAPDGFHWEISAPDPAAASVAQFNYVGEVRPGLLRVSVVALPAWELVVRHGDGTVEKVGISEIGEPNILPDGPARERYVDHVPERLSHLPAKMRPLITWAGLIGTEASCGLPRYSEADVLTGLGPKVVNRQPGSFEIRVPETGSVTKQRSLELAGAADLDAFRFFWDLGDDRGRALATDSAGEKVTHQFSQAGTYEVVVTAVDDELRPIAQATSEIEVQDAPSEAELGASRFGRTLTLTGSVSDGDDCLTYELIVEGEIWDRSRPCTEELTDTDVAFDVRQTVGSDTLPPGSVAELRVFDAIGGQVLSREAAVSGAPNDRLEDGPVAGRFTGGFAETDTYNYTAWPPDGKDLDTLVFCLLADPGARLTAIGPLFPWLDTSRERRTLQGTGHLTIPAPQHGLGGSEWRILVQSNGVQGSYHLSTNLLGCRQGDENTRPEGCYRKAGARTCRDEPPPSVPRVGDRVLLSEGFETRSSTWQARDRAGAGFWHRTGYAAATGTWSLHMGRPGAYPAYANEHERDRMRFQVPVQDISPDTPLRLRFTEALDVDPNDQLGYTSVQVRCTGLGGPAPGDRTEETVFERVEPLGVTEHPPSGLRFGKPGWMHRNIEVDCSGTRIQDLRSIQLEFEVESFQNNGDLGWGALIDAGGRPCFLADAHLCNLDSALGWFLDDIRLVAP